MAMGKVPLISRRAEVCRGSRKYESDKKNVTLKRVKVVMSMKEIIKCQLCALTSRLTTKKKGMAVLNLEVNTEAAFMNANTQGRTEGQSELGTII